MNLKYERICKKVSSASLKTVEHISGVHDGSSAVPTDLVQSE